MQFKMLYEVKLCGRSLKYGFLSSTLLKGGVIGSRFIFCVKDPKDHLCSMIHWKYSRSSKCVIFMAVVMQ